MSPPGKPKVGGQKKIYPHIKNCCAALEQVVIHTVCQYMDDTTVRYELVGSQIAEF